MENFTSTYLHTYKQGDYTMKNMSIEATKYTPSIEFDATSRVLSITGKSYPENTFEFYTPVTEWIKEFLTKLNGDTILLNLDLEYLNSSSLKAYFDLFDLLEGASLKGASIKIKWLYDEENDIAEETGEDFIEDFKDLDIELVIK